LIDLSVLIKNLLTAMFGIQKNKRVIMDFSLKEEQCMWKDVVHDFVAHEVKPQATELSEAQELNWPAIRFSLPRK